MLERLTLIMSNFFLLPENAHSEKAVVALLKAIREPDEIVITAGRNVLPARDRAHVRRDKALLIWQAMIDEILGEGK